MCPRLSPPTGNIKELLLSSKDTPQGPSIGAFGVEDLRAVGGEWRLPLAKRLTLLTQGLPLICVRGGLT